jgi:hypothetical protein
MLVLSLILSIGARLLLQPTLPTLCSLLLVSVQNLLSTSHYSFLYVFSVVSVVVAG